MPDKIDNIIMKLPSISDKAKLMSHVAILEDKAKNLSGEEEARKIVDWINKTWPTKTVRAKMAQKIARLIEEGEHKKSA